MAHVLLRDAITQADATVADGTITGTLDLTKAGLPLELALIETIAALETVGPEWTALHTQVAGPGHIFQSFGWCWQWAHHYSAEAQAGYEMAIVTGRLNGRLVMVMPLAVSVGAGVRELVWLGEPVSQYGDILAAAEGRQPEAMLAAWQFGLSRTRADVANLRKVRADATVAPLLQALGACITCTEEAPYLDLSADSSFEAWEERRQPKARKNRKRQARRLAEIAPVSFGYHVGGEEAASLARHAIELKRETLGAKGGISPALSDFRFAAFFTDAARNAQHPTGVTIRTICCGDDVAAMKVFVDDGRTSCLHVAVFNPQFERCGAGAVLLEHTIREAIRNGYDRLDLLAPRHDYKTDFADGIVKVQDHALAVTAKGWLYTHAYLKIRRNLKAMLEASPTSMRKLVARVLG